MPLKAGSLSPELVEASETREVKLQTLVVRGRGPLPVKRWLIVLLSWLLAWLLAILAALANVDEFWNNADED